MRIFEITEHKSNPFVNRVTMELCAVIQMDKDDCFFFPTRFSVLESPQLLGKNINYMRLLNKHCWLMYCFNQIYFPHLVWFILLWYDTTTWYRLLVLTVGPGNLIFHRAKFWKCIEEDLILCYIFAMVNCTYKQADVIQFH